MLTDDITTGAKLVGLAELITSGKPASDGLYRVVSIGGSKVIEFFDAATRAQSERKGMFPVKILPYRPGMIADVALAGQEAISGEFTGCLMTVFDKGGATYAGHVDTNLDTSQRGAWNGMKDASALEYDTTGKLTTYPGGADSTVILCVARKGTIEHYYVKKSRHSWGVPKANHLGAMQASQGTIYEVLPSYGQ